MKDLIDRLLDMYAEWREECVGVRAAYVLWSASPPPERDLAFAAYQAALDREEWASFVYADLVRRLQAGLGTGRPAEAQEVIARAPAT